MDVLLRNSALVAWATTAARTNFSAPRKVAVVITGKSKGDGEKCLHG